MAKQQIIVLPLVEQKLNELLDALIFKGYFSYYENAFKYVAAIRYFMHSIPVQRRYETSNTVLGTANTSPIKTLPGLLALIPMVNCSWYGILQTTIRGIIRIL